MSHLHLECVGGASGDMMLGALVALGAPRDELTRALGSLGTAPFELIVEQGESMHITGTRLRVKVAGHPEAAAPAEPHDHDHHHGDHHHHDEQAPDHHHHHEHRALADITKMIADAPLPEEVKADALRVFALLGRAEAKIHGVPVEQIHFHEVGADDSILDIVGCCWARHALGVTSVSVGPVPLGLGTIRCAHGVYPNPAPATLELTLGMPVIQTGEPFELVTPTGAALLAAWKNCDGPATGAVLTKVACGLGQRSLHHRPNLLRASIYAAGPVDENADRCLMIACNLDDTTPEMIGALMDDVLAAGALDVTGTPVIMKKQRPGIVLSVLCETAMREKMLDLIFRGSTTFGVRMVEVDRAKLERRFETVETDFGPVQIKIGRWRGEDITRSPEFEDCRRIARARGVSVRAVYDAALRAG